MAFLPINPIIIPLEKTISSAESVTSSLKIWGRSLELKAESYGGQATIRYNGVLKHSFEDVVTSNPIFNYDHNISLDLDIDGEKVWVTRARKMRNYCGFLSLLSPKLYEGYPLDIALSIVQDRSHYSSVHVYVDGVEQSIGGGYGNFIYVANAHGISEELKIVATTNKGHVEQYIWKGNQLQYIRNNTELSNQTYIFNSQSQADLCNPFYVRWINEFGGYDYWMYEGKQRFSRKIDKAETFEGYDAMGKQTILSKEASETISASSGIITKLEAEALSYLLLSPHVAYWNMEEDAWIPLIVDKGNQFQFDSDQPTGEVITTFILPTPQIVL